MKTERGVAQSRKMLSRVSQKAGVRNVMSKAPVASSRKSPVKKAATMGLEARRAQLSKYFDKLFSQPWLQELAADLGRRQAKSNALMEEIRKMDVSAPGLWPYFGIMMPVVAERTKGSRLYDADGNEYIDLFMGYGTSSLHGHNAEPVVQIMKDLMGKSVGNGYSSGLHVEYLRLLKDLVPHREKWAFQESGSAATSGAIRLARAASGRRLVVRFEGSINGQYDITSHNTLPLLHGHPLLPFPPKKGPEVQAQSYNRGAQVVGKEDVLILTFNDPRSLDIIKKRKNEIACVITEPLPQFFPIADKALPFIKELGDVCKKAGVILILDEVHSGFRFGPSGATGHANLHADLVCYGKVMTSLGMPLSAFAGRSDLMDMVGTSGRAIQDFGNKAFIATTHNSNHLAIAASYASLSLLKQKGPAFYERTRKKVQRMREKLATLDVAPDVSLYLYGSGEFYGGLVFAKQPPQVANSIREFVQSLNPVGAVLLSLLLRRKGVYTHGMPQFYTGDAHSDQDLDTVFEKVRECVAEMKQNGFNFSSLP
jgi:glutamate-1-semialdehyde aminotransferase